MNVDAPNAMRSGFQNPQYVLEFRNHLLHEQAELREVFLRVVTLEPLTRAADREALVV